ncbi:MAG TPA: condensation domain-containing protein, partial [Chitinophaga sp.]|uniref:condensation domain-containing protein n=1 Tax=Chitinophaga sp. TaxID=1869181 RepID=UPI002F934E22
MTTQKKKRTYPEDACNIVAASPQQQGVWFHAAGKGISFWNFTQKKAYRGPLNADALKSALEAVLKRHSSLRTSFRIYDDQLCQLIRDNIPVEDLWEHEKFDNTDPVFIERTLSAASRREELYEFDIENECLVRFKVLEFGNESYFILTMNHIITDMFSMQLCWTELARYYNEYLSGRAPALSLPDKQYFEYAISQNNTAAEAAYAQQKQYWLNKLSGQRPVLDLSFYKSAPSIYYRETDLPAALTAEIRVLSLRKKVLHSAVYQLAYFILLHKYSKHNRISIGNIVNGRGFGKRQYTDVIGLFAKRLVNTLDLQEDDTVSSLLERVNKDLLDSFAHSDVPYEEIVREINRKERTGLAPLFQAVFNMIKENGASLSFEGLTECPVPGSGNDLVGDDQYDVGITLTDNGQRVRVRLDLKCDVQFEPLSDYMLRNYVEILEACVGDMSQRVADIGITEEERSLLNEFSGGEVNYPRNKTMVDLLEAQALRTPEGIAVVCGTEQINY